MSTDLELSIVIPALNEGSIIGEIIQRLHQILSRENILYEIIIVDGGSADNTKEVAKRSGARVVDQIGRGFGKGLITGFLGAKGNYILTMDADFSHDPYFVMDLYKARNSAEVIIASRYIRGGYSESGWARRYLSKILNTIYRRTLSLPIRDLSSNFRLYKRNVLREVEIEGNDFEVLEEIVIKIYGLGYKIAEVPFHYRPRTKGYSKARLFRFGWRLLKMLVKLWRLRNSSFWADYDDRAFDSVIPLQRYWQRKRYKIVNEFITRKGSVLDIGCGSSKIIQGIPQAVGLDLQINKIRYTRQLGRKLVQASVFALPFKDKSFDEIIFSNVIEHIPESPVIISEMKRVLKKGGLLVVGTPDYSRVSWLFFEWIYGVILPRAYAGEHITKYTYGLLYKKLQDMGFRVITKKYICGSEMIVKACL